MEAIYKIEVVDFPAFVLVDDKGNDFFAPTAGAGLSGERDCYFGFSSLFFKRDATSLQSFSHAARPRPAVSPAPPRHGFPPGRCPPASGSVGPAPCAVGGGAAVEYLGPLGQLGASQSRACFRRRAFSGSSSLSASSPWPAAASAAQQAAL